MEWLEEMSLSVLHGLFKAYGYLFFLLDLGDGTGCFTVSGCLE